MKKLLFVFISFLLVINVAPSFAAYGVQTKTSGCNTNNQILPDSACTPGAILTTDINLICKSGYTKTVRDVTLATKKQVFAEYGIPYSKRQNYEVDHLISLEIGGSNDISNLWPEASGIADGSKIKDKFENYLHAQVCNGELSIEAAQSEISTNWLQYYSATTISTKKTSKPQILKPSSTSGSATQVTPPIPPTQPFQQNPSPQTNITQPPDNKPISATALCRDGSYSFSQSRRGTCSHHGGVMKWY